MTQVDWIWRRIWPGTEEDGVLESKDPVFSVKGDP